MTLMKAFYMSLVNKKFSYGLEWAVFVLNSVLQLNPKCEMVHSLLQS